MATFTQVCIVEYNSWEKLPREFEFRIQNWSSVNSRGKQWTLGVSKNNWVYRLNSKQAGKIIFSYTKTFGFSTKKSTMVLVKSTQVGRTSGLDLTP